MVVRYETMSFIRWFEEHMGRTFTQEQFEEAFVRFQEENQPQEPIDA